MIKQKTLWKTLLSTAVISTNLINAECDIYGACDPCEMDSCFGGFNIGADFLYLKSCKDELTYSISTEYQPQVTDGTGTVTVAPTFKTTPHTISQDWKPGFRIHASVDDVLCNWGLMGSYTWYSSCHTSSTALVSDPASTLVTNLQNTIGIPTDDLMAVKANYDLNYQTFDIMFSGNFALRQAQYLKPYFGVVGLYIHQDVSSDSTVAIVDDVPVTTQAKWKNHFDGYGLKVGSEYALTLSDGFSLFANASGVLTVGNHAGSIEQTITINDDETPATLGYCETIVVPGWSIETGIRSFGCFCDVDYELQLAYLFTDYCNIPNVPVIASTDADTISFNSTTVSNLGVHGIVFGAKFSF